MRFIYARHQTRHSIVDRFQTQDGRVYAAVGRPLVLTVNGKAEIVVQDAASYQEILEAAEDAKTLKALLSAKAGKGRPASEVFAELRKKYSFPEKRPRK